jgi:peptidoglycan/xylan/chitin deacetylase (PgdA/CDA1 family)
MESLLVATSAAALTAGAVTAYGAAWPRSGLFGPVISATNSSRKLALTFDDGPNPAITPQLLELLHQYNARATFFVMGKFVRDCPELLRQIAAQGHAVGNHTETHPNLLWCGAQETRDQLRRCNDAIFAAAGETPKWFRPPFGFRSPWLGGIAQELQLSTIMWSRIPGDWRTRRSPEWLIRRMGPIAKRAQKNVQNSSASGDILCLHDGNHASQNGDRTRTLAALQYWLPRWRDLGLKFVTIDDAIENAGD